MSRQNDPRQGYLNKITTDATGANGVLVSAQPCKVTGIQGDTGCAIIALYDSNSAAAPPAAGNLKWINTATLVTLICTGVDIEFKAGCVVKTSGAGNLNIQFQPRSVVKVP